MFWGGWRRFEDWRAGQSGLEETSKESGAKGCGGVQEKFEKLRIGLAGAREVLSSRNLRKS